MRHAIARANPLAQLSVGVCSLISALFVRDVTTGLVACGAYALAGLLFLPTWRYPLVCLLLSSVTAATLFYSAWRLGGHDVDDGWTAALRVLVVGWPGAVAAGYVEPAALGDYLAQSLRLPARMVAAFSAALQRFADFLHAWDEIGWARRARGIGPSLWTWPKYAGSMGFAMLVHALRGASQTAIAMDARGFATARGRTWALPATWTRLDVIVVAVSALLGLVAPVATIGSR